jgi:hypothetical protein
MGQLKIENCKLQIANFKFAIAAARTTDPRRPS